MENNDKENLLCQAKSRLSSVIPRIRDNYDLTQEHLSRIRRELHNKPDAESQYVLKPQEEYCVKRLKELSHLGSSPYFFRCDVTLKSGKSQTIYISRFSFSEEKIFSWVAPISRVRFDPPGPVSYQAPSGVKSGFLSRKDQFMIIGGNIRFMTTESAGKSRELVYQEYFSQRKSLFLLPEIIEQMERAQDTVIRAHYQGPLLIAGPAGSGKTTLALHRVAYLAQSPDTAAFFPSEQIIVFVHDSKTREYFAGLLPQLGIEGVAITTFADWALNCLGLQDAQYTARFGDCEQEQDEFEYAKYSALQKLSLNTPHYIKQPYNFLTKVYTDKFNATQKKLWLRQKSAEMLDRFDLTALLMRDLGKGKLAEKSFNYRKLKNGKWVQKLEQRPIQYALSVVDEVENYLPEQLRIIQSCTNTSLRSIIYVGDLAQQTHLCTLKDWHSMNESFVDERKVVLQKVYRSTRQILEYIQSLRYAIKVPDQARMGAPVVEYQSASIEDEITYIKKHVHPNDGSVIGVLAKNSSYLSKFNQALNDDQRIHLLNFSETQGVEFDKVFLVGLNEDQFPQNIYAEPTLAYQRQSINRDLLYVALTRSISELHILGNKSIRSILKDLEE